MKRYSISELQRGYETKEFSPVEITQKYLETIKSTSKTFNSFITVTEDLALKQAKSLEAKLMTGNELGKLFGIPLSYKDNIQTKDIRTTNGSLIDQNYVPSKNAKVVSKLGKEDAITLGKTNMHEYAFGITSTNEHYGAVKNPWDTEYIPGGSSGGSAVSVATNQTIASLGTDTGGSIRIPAAACGIVGLNPTNGKISTKGIAGISWTLDNVGPLAANMSDLAIMMEALTDNLYSEYCIDDIKGLRIGVPTTFFNQNLDAETYEFYLKTLRNLVDQGAILIEVEIPTIEGYQDFGFAIAMSEAGYFHQEKINSHLQNYGNDVREVMKKANTFGSLDYIIALKKCDEYEEGFRKVFEKVDLLATPTMPIPAEKIGVAEAVIGDFKEGLFDCLTRYNFIFNMIGYPALTIPCGITKKNLPVGFQLVGPKNSENILIKAGYSYEQNYLHEFYKKRDEHLLFVSK